MAEELQSLLEKINSDGIQKAEAEKAKIIAAAEAEAAAIRAEAAKDAAAMRAEAEKENDALYRKTVSTLQHSRRDILLQLRNELQSRLETAVGESVAQALTPEFMAQLIRELCTAFAVNPDQAVTVRCAVKDQAALDTALRGALADSLVKSPAILGTKGIAAGMELSVDGGKCYYDFTADALEDVMEAYLGEKLTAMFKADK